MKLTIKILAITSCMLLLTIGNCFAFSIIGNASSAIMNPSHNRPSGFAGGEFTLITNLGEQYASFCVEWKEHIRFGKTYTIDSVTDYANMGGGINHGASMVNNEYRDYLSIQTKWLMNDYVNGDLKSRYGSYSSPFLGAAMQVAIWTLEQEHYLSKYDNTYGILANALIDDARINSQGLAYSQFQNVKVVNLTDAQSQIVAAPVPEPATMLLLGTGLIGVAGIRRKLAKQKK